MNSSKNEESVLSKIEKTILTELVQTYDFIKEDLPKLRATQFQDTGTAFRKITLSEIRLAINSNPRTEAFDSPILKALDNICKRGKAILFDIRFMRNLEYHDMQLCFEIGQGLKTFEYKNITTKIIRLYAEKPLSKKEMSSRNILDPKDRINQMKKERDAGYTESFGKAATLESQLHRENIEDEINKHRSLIGTPPVKLTPKGIEIK